MQVGDWTEKQALEKKEKKQKAGGRRHAVQKKMPKKKKKIQIEDKPVKSWGHEEQDWPGIQTVTGDMWQREQTNWVTGKHRLQQRTQVERRKSQK